MEGPSALHQRRSVEEGAVSDARYHQQQLQQGSTSNPTSSGAGTSAVSSSRTLNTSVMDFRLQPRNPKLSLQRTSTGSAVGGGFAKASRGRKRCSNSLQPPNQSSLALTNGHRREDDNDSDDKEDEDKCADSKPAYPRVPVRTVSFVPKPVSALTSQYATHAQQTSSSFMFDGSIVSPSNTPAQKPKNHVKPLSSSAASHQHCPPPPPPPPSSSYHASSPGGNLNGALRGLALHSPNPSPSVQQQCFSHQFKSSPFAVSGKPTHQPCASPNRPHGHGPQLSSSPNLCSPPGLVLKTNATPPPHLKTAPLRLVTHTPAGLSALMPSAAAATASVPEARKKKRPPQGNEKIHTDGGNPKLTKSPKISMESTPAESWFSSPVLPPKSSPVHMMLDLDNSNDDKNNNNNKTTVPSALSSSTSTPRGGGGGWSLSSPPAAAFSSPSSLARTPLPTIGLAPRSSDGSRQRRPFPIPSARPSLSSSSHTTRHAEETAASSSNSNNHMNENVPSLGLLDDSANDAVPKNTIQKDDRQEEEAHDSKMPSSSICSKGGTPLTQSDVSFIPLPDWGSEGNDDSNENSPIRQHQQQPSMMTMNSTNFRRNAAVGVSLLHPPSRNNRMPPDPIDQMMLALESSHQQGDVLDNESLSLDEDSSSGFLLVAPRDVEEQAALRPSKRRSSSRLSLEDQTNKPRPQEQQDREVSDGLSSLPQLPRSASSGAVATRDLVTPPAMKQGSSPPPLLPASHVQFH